MKDYLHLIDTHTAGPRCDVTPLFAHPAAFAALVGDLCLPFRSMALDYVAGIDALGFILGTAMAMALHKGFVPIRKAGKLPVETVRAACRDYTGGSKTLELRKGIILPGTRVLVVDEWVETGAQMQAAIELVEAENGIVVGIATINMDRCPLTQHLRDKYYCHCIWEDMEEA